MVTRKASASFLAVAALAGVLAGLVVLAIPARSESGFQSERLMTWQRGPADDQIYDVSGFAVARDGSIYVGTQGYVKRFAPDGRFLLTTAPELDSVSVFAVDSKGCIYVVHGVIQDLISKFDPRGVLLSDDPMEAQAVAERLAFDVNGNLLNRETVELRGPRHRGVHEESA